MPTQVNIKSNYTGTVAGEIIGKAFLEANTISSGILTVYDNVNFKLNLRKIETSNGKRAYTCGFVPAGSITLSEKVLEPKKFKDDFQVCKEDFRRQWSGDTMGASAHNNNLPADIEDAILVQKLGELAEEFENEIWNGDGSATQIKGFLPMFKEDKDVIKVKGVEITEDNVVSELKRTLKAIPKAILKKNLNICVSLDIAQSFNFELITKGILAGLGAEDKDLKFGVYSFKAINGLPPNTIVIAEPKNLVFGTGLLEDFNQIRLVDEDETGQLTGMVRGTMVYSAGVEYYNGEEIVYYSVEPTDPETPEDNKQKNNYGRVR